MSVTVRHLGGSTYEVKTDETSLVISIPVAEGEPRSGLRPSEMLLGALGACMLSTGVEFLHRQGQQMSGAALELDYELESRPVRISRVKAAVSLPDGLSDVRQGQFARAISRCTIHNSLHHSIDVDVDLRAGKA